MNLGAIKIIAVNEGVTENVNRESIPGSTKEKYCVRGIDIAMLNRFDESMVVTHQVAIHKYAC
jgi:hypothetical protein